MKGGVSMGAKKQGEFELMKRCNSLYGEHYYDFYDAEEDEVCYMFIDDEI